jgi:NAD(P)-dependent dehydrogenase (short-subunit alcohol dehydrogenase family)
MGALISALVAFFLEAFPPATKFTAEDIPDLSGSVAIVTGGASGIGLETVKALLTRNAKVYIAGRSKKNAHEAINNLKEQTGKCAHFLQLDLGDLKSTKTAAEMFNSKEPELHMLFNNAGVMAPPVSQLTADGYDLQFGTNVLGHYYLTTLLLPALLSGTKSSRDGKARVINTSSAGHQFNSLDFNTFKDSPLRRQLPSLILYNQSKYGNVVFSAELARRYGTQGIVSTSVNPGNIKTNLQRHLSLFETLTSKLLLWPAPMGALTQLYAGTSTDGKDLNGKHLIPWARMGNPRADTQDPKVGRELWAWLEEQT